MCSAECGYGEDSEGVTEGKARVKPLLDGLGEAVFYEWPGPLTSS